MKYYIIKPKRHAIDENLILGIKLRDKEAIFVDTIDDCDKVVLQKGWTSSKLAIVERNNAVQNSIACLEGYLYTDRYTVHLN